MIVLTSEIVTEIHDGVLNQGELAGLAIDKSLEGALGRVEQRIGFGQVQDVFDLAASYAMAIARGHCFNDANKRTAFRAMDICLIANGINTFWRAAEIGDEIIRLAQGLCDEIVLAEWLREKFAKGQMQCP